MLKISYKLQYNKNEIIKKLDLNLSFGIIYN